MSELVIDAYNPVRGGYLQLMDFTLQGKKATLIMTQKFDTLSESEVVNAYEQKRRLQIKEWCENEDRQLVVLDYKEVGLAFKQS